MNELLDIIKKNKKEYNHENATVAEQLRYRAYNSAKTDSDWLQLEQDIQAYIATNPSEEEKKILFRFGEMVGMRCSAIRLKKMDKI